MFCHADVCFVSCVHPVSVINAASGVNRGQVVLSGFNVRLFCFVQAKTLGNNNNMASIDHLDQESLTLKVKDHSDMLSAQYLVNCLEEDHICHGITTQEPRPRPMKETLYSRHHSIVLP